MKHQYFGDVNDYRKYGLLRTIQRETGLRLGVWWMLTPNDGRSDGKFTEYLDNAARWRRYDPPLFDALAAAVPVRRAVDEVHERRLLGDAPSVDSLVLYQRLEREASFSSVRERLRDAELIFLDPDNGLEVPSCPPGRKTSSKYVFRTEIAELFASGQSLVVYQHFRREERTRFIRRSADTFRSMTSATAVGCLQTANVAFFLICQPAHEVRLRAAATAVSATWGDQIRSWFDRDP
jgi:hypothetical protein